MVLKIFIYICIFGAVFMTAAKILERKESASKYDAFYNATKSATGSESFDVLFLGSSTWGQGDVHFSWVDALFEISSQKISFAGKTLAFFGAGDAKTHGEHFCSALGKFYQTFSKTGAKIVGFVDASEYNYEASLAEMDGKLCGLAIDNINEPGKTQERIENWLEQLKNEL